MRKPYTGVRLLRRLATSLCSEQYCTSIAHHTLLTQDREIMRSDPHKLIEGTMICGVSMGARAGALCARALLASYVLTPPGAPSE